MYTCTVQIIEVSKEKQKLSPGNRKLSNNFNLIKQFTKKIMIEKTLYLKSSEPKVIK